MKINAIKTLASKQNITNGRDSLLSPAPFERHSTAKCILHEQRPRNILIPVDFSKCSKSAVSFAIALAEPLGACITLIHVVEDLKYPADFGYGPVIQKLPNNKKRRQTKTRLKRLAHAVYGKTIAWNVFVLNGPAHEMIVRAAKELHADLVVLPIHDQARMDVNWPKTILNYTIHNLSCPILAFQNSEKNGQQQSKIDASSV